MLNDILKQLQTRQSLIDGTGSTYGRIGRKLNFSSLSESTQELVVNKLVNAENDGIDLQEIDKLIANMGEVGEEDVKDLFSHDFEIVNGIPVVPMHWYKLASKSLNRIKQLTDSGKVLTRVKVEESDNVGQREWDGESISSINELHIVSNKNLFILDKTVNQPYKVEENLKTEIIAVDVSVSMNRFERWTPLKLFLFNRIQAAANGEIILKIILFGSHARKVEIGGTDTFTKVSNIKAIEYWAYRLLPTDGSTDFDSALELAKSMVNPNGKNTLTVFTDEGSGFSSHLVPRNTMVNAICVAYNPTLMTLCKRTRGQYYNFSDLLL